MRRRVERPRVVVTGLGQLGPHGRDPLRGFEALLQGRSAIGLHTLGEAPHGVSLASATVAVEGAEPDLPALVAALVGKPRAVTMERVSQLSVVAALDAWADAGLQADGALDPAVRQRAGVLWGSGAGGAQTLERSYRELFLRGRPRLSPLSVVQGMHNAAASHLALQLGLGGACLSYAVACASSAVAIAEAVRRIRSGDCELALAGGAEAAFPYGMVKAWQAMQVLAGAEDEASAARACRPFHRQRQGLVLGEGAAALVLEEREHALARGARIHAELVGLGASCDAAHLTAPQAEGQCRALRAALDDADAQPGELAYVNAHGTATAEGDPVEIAALRELLGDQAARVAVSATKSLHGHLMGATGALEALITVLAVREGCLPPTGGLDSADDLDAACAGVDHVMGSARRGVDVPLALSNSFAFGGSNQVLAFRPHRG